MVEQSLEADLEQEIDLYISSGYWQAEDILSFSENPNLILDEIIEEEWGGVESSQTDTDTDVWWLNKENHEKDNIDMCCHFVCWK